MAVSFSLIFFHLSPFVKNDSDNWFCASMNCFVSSEYGFSSHRYGSVTFVPKKLSTTFSFRRAAGYETPFWSVWISVREWKWQILVTECIKWKINLRYCNIYQPKLKPHNKLSMQWASFYSCIKYYSKLFYSESSKTQTEVSNEIPPFMPWFFLRWMWTTFLRQTYH